MIETIQHIMETVPRKKVQSLCKKVLKKCSFNSSNDMKNMVDLARWLYVYGYYDEILKIAELTKDATFNGNYTLWAMYDGILCLKARVLRERGDVQEAKVTVDYINQYRSPHLYKNLVDWYRNTVNVNIRVATEQWNSKALEYNWRLGKMGFAIDYREAGDFPISDEEFEKDIQEQIAILSRVK